MTQTIEEDTSGADARMEKKQRTRRVIVVYGESIDEDDFNVLEDVEITEKKVTKDGAFRVYELKTREDPLPRNIGDLDYLQSLNLSNARSIPASIGKLQRLKKLNLDSAYNILNLPEEIGNLVSLEELTLSGGVQAIPSSIGKLLNLKQLNLKYTWKLSSLPEEIGNLVSLEELLLSHSGITTLPSSIGKLENLKQIRANFLRKLEAWPEEIGNLVSLEYFSLCGSKFTSLPSFICRLKNLRLLGLNEARALSDLPVEIGNLTNLVCLDIERTNVRSLPNSFGELKNLQFLQLRTNDPLALAKRYPSLLHVPVYFLDERDLVHQLGRNRLRFHVSEMEGAPGLWPYMLKNAETAVESKSIKLPFYVERHFGDTLYMVTLDRSMSSADAIYEFLTVGRDVFIRALVGRNKTSK